jgi:hypothetical protein
MRPDISDETVERIDRIAEEKAGVNPSFLTFEQKLTVLLEELEPKSANEFTVSDSGNIGQFR